MNIPRPITGQIVVWEKSTRLEAGLKRELFEHPRWPIVRACRSARQVGKKRDCTSPAVLVLDAETSIQWIEEYDNPQVAAVRAMDWNRVIAVVPLCRENTWQWTTTGITTVLSGPVHDCRIADCCLRALGFDSAEIAT